MGLVAGLVIMQRDLGTALVIFAIMLAMLWVVGAPGKLFALAFSVIAVGAFYMATTNDERRGRLLNFIDPFKEYHDAGWQPARGLYAQIGRASCRDRVCNNVQVSVVSLYLKK